jgi:hypothetical protein
MELVKSVLCETASNDKRERSLPNRSMVYLVIAMPFFPELPYLEIFRRLEETKKWLHGPLAEIETPVKSAITQARQRLGDRAMKRLSEAVLKPIAIPGETKGSHFAGRQLIAIDAMVIDVPDTEANAMVMDAPDMEANIGKFPRPTSVNSGPYPQVRVVGFVECGTHVMFDFEHTKWEDKELIDSEHALAERLLPRASRGQLVLGDRLYGDGKKWRLATSNGADVIFRVKSDIRLDVEEVLPDGSYKSTLYEGRRDKKNSLKHPVRVVEFSVVNNGQEIERYRLITTLKEDEASAEQIAQLYRERWEWEIFGNEFKADLGGGWGLRSKTPELVRQELYAAFIAHFIVRAFMHEAALTQGEDVDRLSFSHCVNVIIRRAPMSGAFPP